jgi:AraC-like DNA-binding protein
MPSGSASGCPSARGYYDQAYLSRSLKRLIGQTPARIRRHEGQLSLLYKTSRQG